MDSADAVIPISQNECQSHAFEAKHVNWDAGRDQRFCIKLPIWTLQKRSNRKSRYGTSQIHI